MTSNPFDEAALALMQKARDSYAAAAAPAVKGGNMSMESEFEGHQRKALGAFLGSLQRHAAAAADPSKAGEAAAWDDYYGLKLIDEGRTLHLAQRRAEAAAADAARAAGLARAEALHRLRAERAGLQRLASYGAEHGVFPSGALDSGSPPATPREIARMQARIAALDREIAAVEGTAP